MCTLAVQFPAAQSPEATRDVKEYAQLDGFNVKEWSEYAKRKSRIATVKCRENGKLKNLLRDRHIAKKVSLSDADPLPTATSKMPSPSKMDEDNTDSMSLVANVMPYVAKPEYPELEEALPELEEAQLDESAPDARQVEDATTDAPESFDEFLKTFNSKMQHARGNPPFPRATTARIRDIMRPHQSDFWEPWVLFFFGGSGDPANQNSLQLETYLQAIGKWSQIQFSRGLISEDKLRLIEKGQPAAFVSVTALLS